MNLLQELKKQMTVVSNPRYSESIGGYELYFVGTGMRRVDFQGWWPTRLDFYSFDAVGMEQRVRVKGGKEFLREADIVPLFAPNVLYEEYYDRAQSFQDAWVVFRAVGRHDPLRALLGKGDYRLFRDEGAVIRELIHEVAQIASPDAGRRCLAQAAFLQIIAHFHLAAAQGGQIGRAAAAKAKNTFHDKVTAILTESDEISVNELARRLSLSRSALSHKFSAEMGETFVEMKNRMKIRRAQDLLKDPEKQVKLVAFEVGMKDPAYFTHLFKRLVGVTPQAYRDLAQRHPPPR